jgi:hypothetical protein
VVEPMTVAERVAQARTFLAQPSPTRSSVFRAGADLFPNVDGLPEMHYEELSLDHLASGLQHHGGLVVRGLLRPAEVDELRVFAQGGPTRVNDSATASGDADRMVSAFSSIYRQRGILDLIEGYLAEPPLALTHRTLVKRNEPSKGLPWHQDASFYRGQCGSIALWIALTECGRACPSLMLVPRRVERIIDPEQSTVRASAVLGDEVEMLLAGQPAVRPLLEPGDAIVLDEMTVHATGTGWEQPYRDVAITWFFAPSRLPVTIAEPLIL